MLSQNAIISTEKGSFLSQQLKIPIPAQTFTTRTANQSTIGRALKANGNSSSLQIAADSVISTNKSKLAPGILYIHLQKASTNIPDCGDCYLILSTPQGVLLTAPPPHKFKK